MKKKFLATLLIAAMAATMAAGCGTSDNTDGETESTESTESTEADAENDTGISASAVNLAVQPSAAFIPLYIARENGWIEEALEDYGVTVNWNDFESGPPINESLASGDSDIGVIGDVPTVSAIAAGQDNEIVAIAAEGPASYAMLVSEDSDIESAADLKDKKVATVVGSTGHNLTDKLLKVNDLSIDSDIELVNISAGDAATVLETGEVDAVAIWEPTVTRLEESGIAKIIGTGEECGLLGVNPIVARAEFAQENPEIIKIIIEQYARGVAALADLDEELLEKLAEDFSIEASQVVPVAEKYAYTVTIAQEDIDALQDTIQFLVGVGVLDEEYEIDGYVTTDYIESADISQYLE